MLLAWNEHCKMCVKEGLSGSNWYVIPSIRSNQPRMCYIWATRPMSFAKSGYWNREIALLWLAWSLQNTIIANIFLRMFSKWNYKRAFTFSWTFYYRRRRRHCLHSYFTTTTKQEQNQTLEYLNSNTFKEDDREKLTEIIDRKNLVLYQNVGLPLLFFF